MDDGRFSHKFSLLLVSLICFTYHSLCHLCLNTLYNRQWDFSVIKKFELITYMAGTIWGLPG